jgi:hypothetical protein
MRTSWTRPKRNSISAASGGAGAQVRAFDPWPVAEATIAGEPLRIWAAHAIEGDHHAAPGQRAGRQSRWHRPRLRRRRAARHRAAARRRQAHRRADYLNARPELRGPMTDRHPRTGGQGLAEVAMRGASLREVMERNAPKLRDPRDRALLMALLSEGARWWLRFDAAIDGLLEKSLRHKDPAIHALLVLGLVQLEILQLQDYAAVAATVEAVRALQRPQLAGLVNAVLRRWQRERETLIAQLDAKPQTRHAHPAWLANALPRDWPAKAER